MRQNFRTPSNKAIHFRNRIACCAGMVFFFTAMAAHAAPVSYNATTTDVYYRGSAGNGLVSGTTSAEYNYPFSTGQNSGYAALTGKNASGVPDIASGAYARSTDGGWIQTQTYFKTSMLVGSGASGLATGTAVTLRLNIELDGSTSVTSGNDAAYTGMNFDYTIKAPDRAIFYPGPEGGWNVPTIMNFNAEVQGNVDNFYPKNGSCPSTRGG